MKEIRFNTSSKEVTSPVRNGRGRDIVCRPRVLMAGMHLTKTRGGISTLIAGILESGLRDDFNFRYVATQAEDYGIARKALLALVSLARFTGGCLGWNPDLVYIHLGSNASLYREGLFVLVARLLGKKVVGHFHAGDIEIYYPSQPRAGQAFIRTVLGMCTRLIACSNVSAGQLESLVPDRPITVIPNAIDVSAFRTDKRATRGGPLKLLFVGAVGKLKGENDLLEALAILRKKGIPVSVSILGYGAETLALRCADLGITDMIEHLGPVPLADRIAFYKSADVFVLPTYAEAMPMSVIEAMAAGLAIVTTDVGGIPEIISTGVTGFLVNPGEPAALAECVESLAKDPELRKTIGDNALREAKAKLDFDRYRERIRKVLMKEVNDR